MKRWLTAAGVAVLVLGGAACGDDSGDDAGSATVEITGAWARNSPMTAANGAAYLTISSDDGDVLVGASVDPSIAATVELHETRMVEGTDTSGMTDSTAMPGTGEMEMVPVDSIEIPAGEPVELKMGGLHIMLIDLTEPLEVGSEFELTLSFETAGDVTITVPVREDAP